MTPIKTLVSFAGVDYPLVFRPLTRGDKKLLAENGISLGSANLTEEKALELNEYTMKNCVLSEIPDDAPFGIDTAILVLIFRFSGTGRTEAETKN